MTITEWFALAGLVFNLGMAIIGLKIKADMKTTEIALERMIDQGDAELKEGLREVELFMRDNFVRSPLFDQVIKMLSTNMQAQFDRLQAGIDRLNDKLDRKREDHG